MDGLGFGDFLVLLLVAAGSLSVLTAAGYGSVLIMRRLFKRPVRQ